MPLGWQRADAEHESSRGSIRNVKRSPCPVLPSQPIKPPLLVPSRLPSTPGHRNGLLAAAVPPRSSRGCRRRLPAGMSAGPAGGPQGRELGVRGDPDMRGGLGICGWFSPQARSTTPHLIRGQRLGLLLLYLKSSGGILIPAHCSREGRGVSPGGCALGRLER